MKTKNNKYWLWVCPPDKQESYDNYRHKQLLALYGQDYYSITDKQRDERHKDLIKQYEIVENEYKIKNKQNKKNNADTISKTKLKNN